MRGTWKVYLSMTLALWVSATLSGCLTLEQEKTLIPGITSVEYLSPDSKWKWAPDADCARCHAGEAASIAPSSCVGSGARQGCGTCHEEESRLRAIHSGSGPTIRSVKTTNDSACLSCHDEEAALADASSQSAVLTDANGLVINPHALPDIANHADTPCSGCHNPHLDQFTEDVDGGTDSVALSKRTQLYCTSCHHENVYECGTCHAR